MGLIKNGDQWEWTRHDLIIHLFHSLVSVILYIHAVGMVLLRKKSDKKCFSVAIKKIQPQNKNWISGLKNIQRVSCSSAVSLCSHLFPL